MKIPFFWWIVGAVVALFLFNKSKTITGQEGNTTTSNSDPFWTVGSAWYSQHFPSGATVAPPQKPTALGFTCPPNAVCGTLRQ